MNIEFLIEKMIADRVEKGGKMFPKCDESEIERQSKYFHRTFGIDMPESYKRILKLTNGVVYNGMKILPITSHLFMSKDIYQANEEMSPEREFVVFVQIDEELYIYDNELNKYVASNLYGGNWKEFESSNEMFEFAIKRAWTEE
jgi:antitoxin component YwqK of YwqJK toxin-antitoxin module